MRRLLQLNGLAILAVVVNHSTAWVFTAMFWWPHRYRPVESPNFDQLGSFDYFALLGIMQLTVFAVPAFLFVTGFFLAYADRGICSALSFKIVGRRLITILVPYLIWSCVIFLGEMLQGEYFTPLEYLLQLVLGQAVPAYFYIPILVQFFIISPFLVPLAKHRWKILLLLSIILQLSVNSIWYFSLLDVNFPQSGFINVIHTRFFGGFLIFFSLGMVAGFHRQVIRQFLFRYKMILVVTLVGVALLSLVEAFLLSDYPSGRGWFGSRTVTSNVYSVAFILCFLAFNKITLPFPGFFDWLGRNSFGIYLIHVSVLEVTARAINQLSPWLLSMTWLFQIILILIAIGIPLAFMKVVKMSPARRSYRYLFG
jgi:probable poly-beta-1,6-N-acetyl-D-glucosamine export protein